MIVIAGPQAKERSALCSKLLTKRLVLTECARLKNIVPLVMEDASVQAIVYVTNKPSAVLLSVVEYISKKHRNIAQLLYLTEENGCSDAHPFDFILSPRSSARTLAVNIMIAIIRRSGKNPADRMTGALRYRYERGGFFLLFTRLRFSTSQTLLLLRLMDVFPNGVGRDDLMKFAFLPFGRKGRTNVSYAVGAINRKVESYGYKKLIAYTPEKGYFLR